MTNPLSSWNGNLPADVLLDSGVLYLGSSIFSAQDGGLKFDPGVTRKQIEFDGKRSDIATLDRTTGFKPMLTGTIMQVPYTYLPDLEPGATNVTIAGGPTGATQIQGKVAGTMYATGDYIANVRAIWQRGDGTFFQIRFPKAMIEKWELVGKDKDEAKIAITIGARLDMAVTGQLVTNPPVVFEYFSAQPS